jgi:hypothetical protein
MTASARRNPDTQTMPTAHRYTQTAPTAPEGDRVNGPPPDSTSTYWEVPIVTMTLPRTAHA